MNENRLNGQPSSDLPGGTVTFLFTDIEGSTELLNRLRDEYASLLSDQRSILRDTLKKWDGHEVDTQGDAFFVSFPRATDAVKAAVEIQHSLAAHTWPDSVEVRVRMGLHTGEPLEVSEEGYVGMDVHRAARIAHVGHGGQVLLSETTAALVRDELPEGVSLLDLGRHLLKDIRRPEHIRQLVIESLPAEFPPLTSLETLMSEEFREPRSVGECPYRGLSAFREADAPFYFGREAFSERLVEAVHRQPLVAVIVGSSGSGKSSAVFAGLLPRLRDEGGWLIVKIRPGGQPFRALAGALLPVLEPGLRETDRLAETSKLTNRLRDGDIALQHLMARALEKSPDTERLLLVVDQFEELYTLFPEAEARGRFKDQLLAAVGSASEQRQLRFVLLLIMRADFMGQALSHRPFADALQEASYLMGPMTREELRAAIEKPAEIQGAVFEAGLVERILDDVGEEPGNLPLLEFALTLLWEQQGDGWLTHTGYEAVGRMEGALAHYANEVYAELEESERERAHRIFVQLVRPGEGTEDTRRVATRAELGDENWNLVQHLADKRLVVTGRDAAGSETVEVVHEALIQGWGQLRGWIEADHAFRTWQERLRASVRQWDDSGRDEGALLRGVPLAEAEEWVERRGSELSPGELGYVEAGIALRERRESERDRRRRRTILALSVGLVAAVSLSFFAFNQRDVAQESALIAEQEAQARATAQVAAEEEAQARAIAQDETETQRQSALLQASIGLGSQAALELKGNVPERAVLLALEALENYPYTWQAERALAEAVFQNHLRLILPHKAWINTVQWSPDQTRVLTASDDGTANVWDAGSGKLIFTLEHEDWIASALWSPSGDRILTHSGDGSVKMWDASSGELVLTITLDQGYASAVDWSPSGDHFLTSSSVSSGSAKIWDAMTGEELLTLSSPLICSTVRCTLGVSAWSPSGDRILTRDYEGTVQVWDSDSGAELLSLLAHQGRATSVSWSPGGDRIVTAGLDGTTKVWDAVSGEGIISFLAHADRINLASWSPAGDRIVTTSWDNTAKVWDASSGEEIVTFDEHNQIVWAAAWSPNGDRIVTGSGDGSARIWDASTGAELDVFFGHTSDVSYVHWSASGEQIVTSGPDGTARIWDVASEMALLEIPGDDGGSWSMAWSPMGDRVARGFEDGRVNIFDAISGKELLTFTAHEGSMDDMAWSPSGDRLLTTGWDGFAKVWDAANGNALVTFSNHEGRLSRGRWSPDGTKIATSGIDDSTVRIWDAVTGEEKLIFGEHQWGVIVAVWSPDGQLIASSDWYGSAEIWDAASGQVLFDLFPEDNQFATTSLVWSPDGSRLVSHSDDSLLRIWDTKSGEEIVSAPGHSASAWTLDWLESGDRILSTDANGYIKLWDAASGAEVFSTQISNNVGALFSPDGRKFAAWAVPNGPVSVFSIWQSLEELIDYARECCVLRQLTPEEREMFGLPDIPS